MDTENKEKKEGKKGCVSELLSWIATFAIAFVIVFIVNHLLIVNAVIPSGSMEHTIDTGDRIFASRLSYLKDGPERGDIIIFNYPVDEGLGITTHYIKRVIGLPGETLHIRDGHVYIDDSTEPVAEPYLKEEWFYANDGLDFEIPDDSYFVMGDNRNHSLDSRFWADEAIKEGLTSSYTDALVYSFVPRDNILGKAMVRYWPLTKMKIIK